MVVYLNTAVSMSDADRKMAFIDGTYNAGKAFDEVWIIKAPEVYQVWSAGHAIFE